MLDLKFSHNPDITLGVEIEIQLIDPKTGDLKPQGPAILKYLDGANTEHFIKAEIFQSMLEIETPICRNALEAGTSLRKSLRLVEEAADTQDVLVAMAGSHPFAHYLERQLTDHSRYHNLVDRNKWITRRLQIFGLHVHLGMRDGQHAIEMANALTNYLPMLLAMSASSPYWHGEDTGLASSRITFFEATPTGGHPCAVATWHDFKVLIDKMLATNSITSLKDLWWDIRLNIDYGTVEIRIADCSPTIAEIEALTALIHSLAVALDRDLSEGKKLSAPPEWIMRENKWRASRHGVAADLIAESSTISVPFVALWNSTKARLKSEEERFGYTRQFQFLDMIVQRGPSYLRQRQAFAKDGFAGIMKNLVLETKHDEPLWD